MQPAGCLRSLRCVEGVFPFSLQKRIQFAIPMRDFGSPSRCGGGFPILYTAFVVHGKGRRDGGSRSKSPAVGFFEEG